MFTAAGNGSGNLLDYWRDISYGQISLEDSELFGPWRMRYSLANDAAGAMGPNVPARYTWCAEARRLLQEHGVDLHRFHAVVAIVNANADGSSGGLDFAWSLEGTWGESGWRFCRNCSALARSSGGRPSGRCPAGPVVGGPHDYSASWEYVLATDPEFPGNRGWHRCSRCQVLVFAPDPARPPGACPAGGSHSVDAARQFRLRGGPLPWGDQAGWQRCSRCSSLVFRDMAVQVPGCAAGGNHEFSGSGMYGVHRTLNGLSMSIAAHESGHGYGLGHAGRRNDPNGYADRWDVMGYGQGFASAYEVSGPGLAAPNRLLLSWIPPERVARVEIGPGVAQRITLAPLDSLEGTLPVVVEAVTGSSVYTVELRRRRGWDQGIEHPSPVLIHELPNSYVAAQPDWRYCGRCRSMNFAGRLKCAGGGIHDVSRSEAYTLGLEGTAVGQTGWRWCRKCQALVSIAISPQMPCSYGGIHDVAGSGRYVVARELDHGVAGQTGWRHCFRCGTLAYERLRGGRSACAAGRVHDFLGSQRYVLRRQSPGQAGWRWCAKCQQLVFMGAGGGAGFCAGVPDQSQGHDFSASGGYAMHPDRDPFEGQRGWMWCRKCNGIVFEPLHGPCAAGGLHEVAGNPYRIPFEPARSAGQSGWKICCRCAGLAFAGSDAPCPAGGPHDLSTGGNYVLPDAREDELKLVPFDGTRDTWRAGDSFRDDAARLAITVESVSARSAVVVVRSPA
jgi:hypothetical protein